jgi:hypothetical protein
MKIKTSELIGAALDWAAQMANHENYIAKFSVNGIGQEFCATSPSTDWSQGGPIIEREGISITKSAHPTGYWLADVGPDGAVKAGTGPTPLIAAMRCFVASKLGDEIEIPEKLK